MTQAFVPQPGSCACPKPDRPLADPSGRLLSMIEEASVLVGIYAPDDYLVYANRAFREGFHVSPHEAPTFEQIIRRNHAAKRGGDLSIDDIDA